MQYHLIIVCLHATKCGCERKMGVWGRHAPPPVVSPTYIPVSKGCTIFRNPRALECSLLSAVRTLDRAQGFLNAIDPFGCRIYVV